MASWVKCDDCFKETEMAGKRQVINVPGLAHQNPIPNGSKIDNIVFSSAIAGRNLKTGEMPTDPDEQAECMFDNLREFMRLAGGTPENIVHCVIYLNGSQYREPMNKQWLKMFPDETSRPARHVHVDETGGRLFFNLEIAAVI